MSAPTLQAAGDQLKRIALAYDHLHYGRGHVGDKHMSLAQEIEAGLNLAKQVPQGLEAVNAQLPKELQARAELAALEALTLLMDALRGGHISQVNDYRKAAYREAFLFAEQVLADYDQTKHLQLAQQVQVALLTVEQGGHLSALDATGRVQ